MKSLTPYSHKVVLVAMVLLTSLGFSQSSLKESFKITPETVVKLNTSYTQITFETWDKNKVEVEAFIEGDGLTNDEKEMMFQSWNFSVNSSANEIAITSLATGSNNSLFPGMDFFDNALSMDPFASQIMGGTTDASAQSMFQNMGAMQFDYKAFQANPQGYMKQFEETMKSTMGKNQEEMTARMEDQMKQMEQQFQQQGMDYTQEVITDENGNKTYIIQGSSSGKNIKKKPEGKKVLIIRMPKSTKTEINVRHGEIKMADASNVRATLNYAPFTAENIDGGDTYITAAYAPVVISNWGDGTLYVKFVDTCDLKNVKEINLTANSSGIYIGTLRSNAKITASFGTLRIDAMDTGFNKLNLVLDNVNAGINIPDTAFGLTFNGKKSTLRYNKNLEIASQKRQYDRVLVDGYYKTKDTEREMLISAAYSNLILR